MVRIYVPKLNSLQSPGILNLCKAGIWGNYTRGPDLRECPKLLSGGRGRGGGGSHYFKGKTSNQMFLSLLICFHLLSLHFLFGFFLPFFFFSTLVVNTLKLVIEGLEGAVYTGH